MQCIDLLTKYSDPHSAIQANGANEKSVDTQKKEKTWTSIDRLNMSLGMIYALCKHALGNGIK